MNARWRIVREKWDEPCFDKLGVHVAHTHFQNRMNVIRHAKRTANRDDQALLLSDRKPPQPAGLHTRHCDTPPCHANAGVDVVHRSLDMDRIHLCLWRQCDCSHNFTLWCFCHRWSVRNSTTTSRSILASQSKWWWSSIKNLNQALT